MRAILECLPLSSGSMGEARKSKVRRSFTGRAGPLSVRSARETFGGGKGQLLGTEKGSLYVLTARFLYAHSAWGRTGRSSLPRGTALHAALHAAHGTLHAAFHIAHPAALAVLAPPGTSLSLGSLPSGFFSRLA